MTTEIREEGEIPLLGLVPLLNRLLDLNSIRQRNHDGLTKSQVLLLAAVSYRGSLNMTQTAESLSTSKEQATRAAAPLVDGGYLRRTEHRENRRAVYLELTDRGRDYMELLRTEVREELNEKLSGALSEAERGQLAASLETVIALLGRIETKAGPQGADGRGSR